MTARWNRQEVRLAWGVGLCSVGVLLASLVLLALDWKAIDSIYTAQLPWFLKAAITAVLGSLIASRRPRNPIGWLLLAIAALQAVSLAATFLSMWGLLSGASAGGWVAWSAWSSNWSGVLASALLAFLVLYFPDGRLPGTRWRLVVRFMIVACAATVFATVLSTVPMVSSPRLPKVPNPLVVSALTTIANSTIAVTNSVAFSVIFLFPAVAVVLRLRRASGVARHQLKSFAYTAAATIGVSTAGGVVGAAVSHDVGDAIANFGFAFGISVAIPATIGLAVMKYGLYDIDVFISRTVVYGSLAVFITSVYVGIAVGIGTLVGSGGRPNLGLSILATAIVAVGFQPIRERLQRVSNRLVYGQRATPYEVLSQFSERVAESYASDEVLSRMARVLADGTGAELAEVWLRHEDVMRRAAAFPTDTASPATVHLNAAGDLSIPAADRSVMVRHQGELLGALSVTKRRGEMLTPIEIKLMDDLARQAGLVLKNVGLTADLQARLDDLRASRQRLVAAQDNERRRLERNLHDGAQQHLVALKVKLGLVEMLTDRDPEQAAATIVQLKHDADEALETLRDLARGIYPPLLADKGLAAALRSQAGKATVPVRVDADGVGRYPQEIEAALYFCTLEALQNVQKYAAASAVDVRLCENGGQLVVEVADDGCGFDVATAVRGAGLTNMEDRLEALGGSLQIESTAGTGSTLRATVPLSTMCREWESNPHGVAPGGF
jgi:signal transduction histidine kinase